jgi:glycosyltransferase involved in cell wall biosynthesis
MRVTVVTVCRNAEGTIADALRSVARQDLPDLEHIVIDGASTDGTCELVRANSSRVARFVSEPDRGIYDAMNKGIAWASGEFTCFLNADDLYAAPGALSALVAALRDRGTDAVHADLRYVARDDVNRTVRKWKGRPFEPGLFARSWAPAHPTFLARTAVLRDAGGFDLRYRLAADFDLMLRLLEVRRIPSAYAPVDAVRMRTGGATGASVRSVIRQNREILDSLQRHGMAPSAPAFVARKVIARIAQRLLALRGTEGGTDDGGSPNGP